MVYQIQRNLATWSIWHDPDCDHYAIGRDGADGRIMVLSDLPGARWQARLAEVAEPALELAWLACGAAMPVRAQAFMGVLQTLELMRADAYRQGYLRGCQLVECQALVGASREFEQLKSHARAVLRADIRVLPIASTGCPWIAGHSSGVGRTLSRLVAVYPWPVDQRAWQMLCTAARPLLGGDITGPLNAQGGRRSRLIVLAPSASHGTNRAGIDHIDLRTDAYAAALALAGMRMDQGMLVPAAPPEPVPGPVPG